jgi:hypothetical protein
LTQEDTRKSILQAVKAAGFDGRIALTSHSKTDSDALMAAGAHLVLEPFQDAADRAVELVSGGAVLPRLDSDEEQSKPAEPGSA